MKSAHTVESSDALVHQFENRVVFDASVAPTMDEAHIERMRHSGVTAFNWTVCSPFADRKQAIAEIEAARDLIEANGQLQLVEDVAGFQTAKNEGRTGLVFGPQNALPVEQIPNDVKLFHDLGVRIFQLTYNEQNRFGCGCAVGADSGLTDDGRRLIESLASNGIVLDLSHGGERTILEAIEASERPPIISHANARAVFESPRNVSDAVLKTLADSGGVIGLTLWSPMVGSDGRRPTVDDFLRHVSYVIDLVGAQHVGIGSDHSEGHPRAEWETLFGVDGRYPAVIDSMGAWYGYDTRFVEGGSSCLDLHQVAERLAGLGLDSDEMDGLLGKNFIRIFEHVWQSTAAGDVDDFTNTKETET